MSPWSLLGPLLILVGCDGLRACVVRHYPSDYAATGGAPVAPAPTVEGIAGSFDGADAGRPQLAIRLQPLIDGLDEPTDIQFPPGFPDRVVILEKGGRARIFSLTNGEELGTLLELDVLTRSEQGLLGLAFHPGFARNGRLFVNHTVKSGGEDVSRVSEFKTDPQAGTWKAGQERVLMEVVQPYANHNAGQLAFGPDGHLWIGWGDGGWRDDPHNHGQDLSSLLGSMLRIDIDRQEGDRAYGIPADNPFLDRKGVPPETWAYGLRNPWRYSFDPQGRLIVADVGQNLWEEVDIVSAGDNLGWKLREGRHCFPPDTRCPDPEAAGLQDPIYEYPRQDGASITGGYVYTGKAIPELAGKYVFGDFTSGRIWALDLPPDPVPLSPPPAKVMALGRFGILAVTFGQDSQGELYVADFGKGRVFRIIGP